MFYESKNSLTADLLKLESGIDFSFPVHLHSSFEYIAVTEGDMLVTVDRNTYTLTPKTALLIFPNQVHELKTPVHSCHFLCIFSPQLVQAYAKICQSRLPSSNLFTPDRFYADRMRDIAVMSPIAVKGLLYSLCGEFDKSAVYIEKDSSHDELLPRIFQFVETNYRHDCSLAALSQATSYNYVYLSKFFKLHTGMSFTDYVNRYRVSEACSLLQNTDRTILETAFECGFESLRSFNRNFKSAMDVTPTEYRARF